MSNLESSCKVPFELGKYSYDLVWEWMKAGSVSLEFSKINYAELPSPAKQVYSSGDLYKIVVSGKIERKPFNFMAESCLFTSYITVQDNDAYPLMQIADTKVLMREATAVTVYDYKKNTININSKEYQVDKQKMRELRDPSSHAIHLLYRPKTKAETYFCGSYHDLNGNIAPLVFDFKKENNRLIGRGKIPAHTYFLNIDVTLELPYSFDADKNMFIPSLKEKIAVSHKVLGKICAEFKYFKKLN